MQIRTESLLWVKKRIFIKDSNMDKIVLGILLLMIGLMGLFAILNTRSFFGIDIWRHDAAYYLQGYTNKLKGEGRWINHILFQLIKQIPAHLSIAICLSSFFNFCFWIGRKAGHPKIYSLAFALLSIQIPILYYQMLWPVTPLPSFIFLGISPFFTDKLKPFSFMMLFGILFLGSLSYFYFLMPLLYLSKIDKDNFIEIFLAWLAGFFVGFFVSNMAVFWVTGNFIKIGTWRHPNPIQSVGDFLHNLSTIINSLKDHAKFIIKQNTFSFNLLLFAVFLFSVRIRSLFFILTCLIVCLSVYASTIPVGIIIEERTALPLWIGSITVIYLRKNIKKYEIIILTTLALITTSNFSYTNNDILNWYKTLTKTYYDMLKDNINIPPSEVKKVTLLFTKEDFSLITKDIENNLGLKKPRGIEGLGEPKRLIPTIKELGYGNNYNIKICRKETKVDSCFQELIPHKKISEIPCRGYFCSNEIETGHLVIMINPKYL
jgi:hypothetical protein